MIRSKAGPIFPIAFYRKGGGPKWFYIDGVAIFKSPHMQLAGGGIRKWTVRPSVYHNSALPTNTLATVVIELHGPLLLTKKLFVQHIQHFQKRHVRGHAWQAISGQLSRLRPAFLAPNFEFDPHTGCQAICNFLHLALQNRSAAVPCARLVPCRRPPTPRRR
jgi:hypothetical protein